MNENRWIGWSYWTNNSYINWKVKFKTYKFLWTIVLWVYYMCLYVNNLYMESGVSFNSFPKPFLLTITFLNVIITVPSASPPSPQVIKTEKNSATVVWDPLHINHTNGVLTGYILSFKENLPRAEYFDTRIKIQRERKYKFIYLLPCTRYLVKVAAVNNAGVGPYSRTTSFVTKGGITKHHQPFCISPIISSDIDYWSKMFTPYSKSCII